MMESIIARLRESGLLKMPIEAVNRKVLVGLMNKGYLSHVDCMRMGGLGVDGGRKEVVYGHDILLRALGKEYYD
jgi:hypothetical protein